MPGNNSRNSPAPQGPQHIGQVLHHRQETLFRGPIPPVEDFEGYERILPGAADRILKMAENQAGHRQSLERRALTGDLVKAMMGTILAYISFAGAMAGAVYLLTNDKPLYGLAALVTALGAAFAPKIYADFIQPRRPPGPPTTAD
jgi:uncharacterized membrane protein